MTHDDDKPRLQPAKRPVSGLPDDLPEGKALQESPGAHPDQSGAEYGGYGHSDSPFGRNPGSSSEEGGQGAAEEAGRAAQPQDSKAAGAKDEGRSGSYRRDERYGGFASEQRASPTPLGQGGDTPAPGRDDPQPASPLRD